MDSASRSNWVGCASRKNKTALAPPAVRAPVFPHAFPVTEGLKHAIRNEVGKIVP